MKVSLSRAFAGQEVGIKEMEDGIWVVSFLNYDLGYFDEKGTRVEPVDDPFGFEKVLPMCPKWTPSGHMGNNSLYNKVTTTGVISRFFV